MTFGIMGANMMYKRLDKIIEAVEAMDGLDHSSDVQSGLAEAIREITRKGYRSYVELDGDVVQPAIPDIAGFENGTAFAIVVTQQMIQDDAEQRGGFTFGFYGIALKSGHSSYSISWGDGTTSAGLNASVGRNQNGDTCLGNTKTSASQTGTNGTVTDGTAECCHTYTSPGMYVIQISDDIDWFRLGCVRSESPWTNLMNAGKQTLAMRYWYAATAAVHALRFGSLITSASRTYYSCSNLITASPWTSAITTADYAYEWCHGLKCMVPEWGANIVNITDIFSNCDGLFGSVPEWPAAIQTVQGAYGQCYGLTGRVPEWGTNIINAQYAFQNCTGIIGSVPEWGAKVSFAGSAFKGCYGLSGRIPKWGSAITSVFSTFEGCRGLCGEVPEWTNSIVNAGSTFSGCYGISGNVPSWGASITSPTWCFYQCYGLTGKIPQWGPAITNITSIYNQCTGLTGVWNDSATDAELMPSTITTTTNAVAGCPNSLREKFLTTWGGTRTT